VADRPDHEGARTIGGHRPAQSLAVHRDSRQHPDRCALREVSCPALFSLQRAGRGSHDRRRGNTTDDVGGLPVQGVAVEITQDTTEGPFAGHQIAAGQGSRRAPSRARTSWEVPDAHCQIADTQSQPTTSVAHAASTSTTTSRWRRPRRFRRSGTRDSRASSDDVATRGSNTSRSSRRARSANRLRAGHNDDTVDTSATPGNDLLASHLKITRGRARPSHRVPRSKPTQSSKRTSRPNSQNAGALRSVPTATD
jgi:hypothetical protein